MWSKIIDQCKSRRWFLGLVQDPRRRRYRPRRRRLIHHLCSAVIVVRWIGSYIFWRLEKISILRSGDKLPPNFSGKI